MCALAAERTSHWLMMDGWEAFKDYQRTAVVLDHFDYEINQLRGGVRAPDGSMRPCRIMLLAGSDLIATMSEPGVWSEDDVSALFPRPRRAIRADAVTVTASRTALEV
jgi:nicotinamide mononucleotide adenylyltransferase